MKKKVTVLFAVLSFISGVVFMAIPEDANAGCKTGLFNRDICIAGECTAGYDGPKCNLRRTYPQ